jgi:hypothetical protein
MRTTLILAAFLGLFPSVALAKRAKPAASGDMGLVKTRAGDVAARLGLAGQYRVTWEGLGRYDGAWGFTMVESRIAGVGRVARIESTWLLDCAYGTGVELSYDGKDSAGAIVVQGKGRPEALAITDWPVFTAACGK